MSSAFNTGAMKTLHKGEIVLFQTDLQRSHFCKPKSLAWNQVTLPQQWLLEDATPSTS